MSSSRRAPSIRRSVARVRAVGAWFAFGACVAGCGPHDAKPLGNVISTPDAAAPDSAAPPPCTPPNGVSGSPTDIDALVTLVNALRAEHASPLEIGCVVESLDRPLGILASKSPFSLQATVDPKNPRFFLFSGNLVIALLPTTEAGYLLEAAYSVSETRSVKAEIKFPIEAPLPPAQPFDHLLQDGRTSCPERG